LVQYEKKIGTELFFQIIVEHDDQDVRSIFWQPLRNLGPFHGGVLQQRLGDAGLGAGRKRQNRTVVGGGGKGCARNEAVKGSSEE